MKHNTPDLMKFKKLQSRLQQSRRSVVGLLELLWIETQKNCPDGAIGKFADDEIAILCDWDGDASTLVDALVECEWIDRHDEHRLVIHDWHIHAPNYIKGNLAKHGKDFAIKSPKQPKQPDCDSAKHAAKHAAQEPEQPAREVAKQPAKHAANEAALSTVPPNLTKPDQTEPNQTKPNRTKKAADADEVVVIPAGLEQHPGFLDAWNAWLADRRERRLSTRPKHLREQLAFLEGLGGFKAVESLKNTVRNSWQGLFDPGAKRGPTRISTGSDVIHDPTDTRFGAGF